MSMHFKLSSGAWLVMSITGWPLQGVLGERGALVALPGLALLLGVGVESLTESLAVVLHVLDFLRRAANPGSSDGRLLDGGMLNRLTSVYDNSETMQSARKVNTLKRDCHVWGSEDETANSGGVLLVLIKILAGSEPASGDILGTHQTSRVLCEMTAGGHNLKEDIKGFKMVPLDVKKLTNWGSCFEGQDVIPGSHMSHGLGDS